MYKDWECCICCCIQQCVLQLVFAGNLQLLAVIVGTVVLILKQYKNKLENFKTKSYKNFLLIVASFGEL